MAKYLLPFFALVFLLSCQGNKKLKPETNIPKPKYYDYTLWDFEQLYDIPNYRVIDSGRVWKIVFEGPVFDDTLREVFAYYSNPDLLRNGVNTLQSNKFPGVVLLHGGGGRAFPQWVEKWAAEGYAAIAFDMSARDSLNHFQLPSGPLANFQTKFKNIEMGVEQMWEVFSVGAGIRAHSLLRSMKEVDENKTVVTGISWGGYLTSIVGSIDTRFKAACPVYGCGYFDEILGGKKYLDTASLQLKKDWIDNLDPKQYLPDMKCPVLFINGNKDFFFSIDGYYKTVNICGSPNKSICIIPDLKHGHAHGWTPDEIKVFFDNQLFDDFPLLKIENISRNDSVLTVEYSSPVSLRYAEFYYSNDTISTNENREWNVVPAKVKAYQNFVDFDIKGLEYKYSFVVIKDQRQLTASSNFMIE